MTISQSLLPEFEHEMANTRKMLEAVPDGKFDWKPHAKSMPLGRLASHVCELVQWGDVIVREKKLDLTPDMKPFIAKTRAELVETLDRNVASARESLAGASDEALLQPWTLSFSGKVIFTMPRIAAFRSMALSHVIHHRAQLGVYLRLLDVPIPGMYGPSADA